MAYSNVQFTPLPKAGFRSTAPQLMQTSLLTPDQSSARQNMLQMAQAGMRDPYAGFAPVAQQARSEFLQKTVPSIMERFTSMAPGSYRGSGLPQIMAQAGVNLDESLAAQQSQYGLQNRQLLQQLAQLGLTPEFATNVIPGQEGWGRQLGGALLSGLPAIAGGIAGMFSRGSQGRFAQPQAQMSAPIMGQPQQMSAPDPMLQPLQGLAQNLSNPNAWSDLVTQGILNPQRVPVRNRLSDWAQPGL